MLQWKRHASVNWRTVANMLNDPYEANRWAALDILKDFIEPALVQRMLRMPSQDANLTSHLLLNDYANIAANAAVPLLQEADSVVRMRACYLIGETGNESHIARLQPLLDDKREAVRKIASNAIQRLQQIGPLTAAVKEFDGDITAAVKKVVASVQTDENGDPIIVDLTQFDTPHRLLRSDSSVLRKLSKLQSLKLTYSSLMVSDVAQLKELPLKELEINYCLRLDDTVADALRTITTLHVLRIENTNVGDRTAAAIGQLQNLEVLDISHTRITDKGLIELGKLRHLRSLDLSQSRVTDKGVSALAGHTELRKLFLLDCGITDGAIPHLETLTGLEFMNLSGSEFSPEGLARLRQSLPNCRGLDVE